MEKEKKEEEMVTISKKKYGDLLLQGEWLRCLESAGVDNWEGYDYAIDLWNEAHDGEDRP